MERWRDRERDSEGDRERDTVYVFIKNNDYIFNNLIFLFYYMIIVFFR